MSEKQSVLTHHSSLITHHFVLDCVVVRFGAFVEFVAVAVAALDFVEEVQFFVILVGHTGGSGVFFDDGLIGCRIVAGGGLGAAAIDIFPVGIGVAAPVTRAVPGLSERVRFPLP